MFKCLTTTREADRGFPFEAGTSRCVTGYDAIPQMQVRDQQAADSMAESPISSVAIGNVCETFHQDFPCQNYRELVFQKTYAEALRFVKAKIERRFLEIKREQRHQRIMELERELRELCDTNESGSDEKRCWATSDSGASNIKSPGDEHFTTQESQRHSGTIIIGAPQCQVPTKHLILSSKGNDLQHNNGARLTHFDGERSRWQTSKTLATSHTRTTNTTNLAGTATNTTSQTTLHTNTNPNENLIGSYHHLRLHPDGLNEEISTVKAFFERRILIAVQNRETEQQHAVSKKEECNSETVSERLSLTMPDGNSAGVSLATDTCYIRPIRWDERDKCISHATGKDDSIPQAGWIGEMKCSVLAKRDPIFVMISALNGSGRELTSDCFVQEAK